MEQLLSVLIGLAAILLAWVLPIVHVVRSDRTPPKMRLTWAILVLAGGLLAYLMWWLMTIPPSKARIADAAAGSAPDGKAVVNVFRSSFFGALVKYRVYLDDKTTPVAEIRGTGKASIVVDPGEHTLFVKSYRWLEFPFDAQAGSVLPFSLDARTDTALTNTVVGWVA